MNYELSEYQKNILGFISNENGNLLVDAKAGSGKTSTLILIAEKLNAQSNKCLFLAFNKHIVEELQTKISNPNCLIKTVHSLGFTFIRSYLYKKHNTNYDLEVDTSKLRNLVKEYYDKYFRPIIDRFNATGSISDDNGEICYIRGDISDKINMSSDELKDLHNNLISDFVGLCNFSRLYNINYKQAGALDKLVSNFCWHLAEYYEDILCNYQDLVIAVIDKTKELFENPEVVNGKPVYKVDYTDMIYFPVYYNMQIPYSIKEYLDTVLVDECIPETHYIETKQGKMKFKELKRRIDKGEQIYVKTFNENTEQLEYKPVISVTDKGVRPVYEITTAGLNKIQATDNHPFMTQNGWKQLKDLVIGEDYLYLDKPDNQKTKYIPSVTSDYNWKQNDGNVVKSIEYVGDKKVLDMEVADNHNFFISKFHQKNGSAILVHNCQDLSILQQKFVKKLDTNYNRFIFVGDKYQSIYMFAGSDTHAIDKLDNNFFLHHLPLNICYRCPENVIRLAQEIVPTIEWNTKREDKGEVKFLSLEEAEKQIKSGDVLIGRKNKDLLKIYRKFVLTLKKPVKFRNSELVATLVNSIEASINEYIKRYSRGLNIDKPLQKHMKEFELTTGCLSGTETYIAELKECSKRLISENSGKSARVSKSNNTIDYLQVCMKEYKELGAYGLVKEDDDKEDKDLDEFYEIIEDFMKEFRQNRASIKLKDFIQYIKSFLSGSMYDDVPIISSVHSMKGGEADNVYIYDYPMFPYKIGSNQTFESMQQERNLQYVAITRAKKNLYLLECADESRKDDNASCAQKVARLLGENKI